MVNTKVLLLAGSILGIIFLVFLFFYMSILFGKKSTLLPANEKPITQNSVANPGKFPSNTSNTNSQTSVQLKQDVNPAFRVSYPESWILDKRGIQNGGTAFTARINSTDTFFPRFEVQETPITGQTMENKIKNLAFYNLSRTETTFKGKPATKLEGRLSLHFDTGNPEQKPVYKVFLFVPTSTTLYTISYAYFIDENRAQSEALMQKMLDSLQLR